MATVIRIKHCREYNPSTKRTVHFFILKTSDERKAEFVGRTSPKWGLCESACPAHGDIAFASASWDKRTTSFSDIKLLAEKSWPTSELIYGKA